jgi:hypothetical protein
LKIYKSSAVGGKELPPPHSRQAAAHFAHHFRELAHLLYHLLHLEKSIQHRVHFIWHSFFIIVGLIVPEDAE